MRANPAIWDTLLTKRHARRDELRVFARGFVTSVSMSVVSGLISVAMASDPQSSQRKGYTGASRSPSKLSTDGW